MPAPRAALAAVADLRHSLAFLRSGRYLDAALAFFRAPEDEFPSRAVKP